MDVTEVLQGLGFGDYEARAYVALLRRSPLNGYELAKLSEIPRANIYAVLQRLEDRAAVVRVDAPEGTRYAPVAPDEMLRSMAQRFQRDVDRAEELLQQVNAPVEPATVSNMRGYQALLEHSRALIASAQERLLLAVWPDEAKALAGEVAAAAERGVGIRTLCLAGCPQECGACRGRIHRHRLPTGQDRWLVVAPDRAEVLAGEIRAASPDAPDDERAQSIRTRQRLLVDLTASFIRNSIALAMVLEGAGRELGEVLPPETRAALEGIGEEEGPAGLLAQISHLWRDDQESE